MPAKKHAAKKATKKKLYLSARGEVRARPRPPRDVDSDEVARVANRALLKVDRVLKNVEAVSQATLSLAADCEKEHVQRSASLTQTEEALIRGLLRTRLGMTEEEAAAWTKARPLALDEVSPEEKIAQGKMEEVLQLVEEMESGFAL